ncbi:MAG: C39 family peptidase [Firmicutes bacterium]|nr:C39 family peptidase [Bacillota bacterium]
MFKSLQHLARTQLLILVVTCAAIGTTMTPAFTDSPFYTRQLSQIAAAVQGSHGRLTFLPDGQGVLIDAPSLDQLPQLQNGCEITSLTMLLHYEGFGVTKEELAHQIQRDPQTLQVNPDGTILSWGNPNDGFVGSVSGKGPGFGVYHAPIAALMRHYLPDDTLDLSGISFSDLLSTLRTGRPIIAWTTVGFSPDVPWTTWKTPTGPVRTTMFEHVVLLVGYNRDTVFVDNPLGGQQAEPVSMKTFRASWVAMGRQAITVLQNR